MHKFESIDVKVRISQILTIKTRPTVSEMGGVADVQSERSLLCQPLTVALSIAIQPEGRVKVNIDSIENS